MSLCVTLRECEEEERSLRMPSPFFLCRVCKASGGYCQPEGGVSFKLKG